MILSVSYLENAKIYVDLFPCNECAKAIIQSGIREVIYLSNKYADSDAVKASVQMFEAAGVKLTQLKTDTKKIELSFGKYELKFVEIK